MANKPSLFFLTTEVPYPLNSGGRIKSFKLIEYLSEHFEVQVLCARGLQRKEDLKAIREALPATPVQAFDIDRPRSAWSWLSALMSFPTLNAYRNFSLELETMVKWSCQKADYVMVDHLEMMYLIPEHFNGKLIYHSHNAEFKIWEGYASSSNNPLYSLAAQWEVQRVKTLERYAIRLAKLTFAAPNDREALASAIDIPEERIKNTYHLGHDQWLALTEIDLKKNEKDLFFGASLSWEPNRNGLEWFIKNCWPEILQKEPKARLRVCGSGADKGLSTLLKASPNVLVEGFVKDLDVVMRSCRLAIVPLQFGSGMKIKTFDALYRGLPLVSTSVGAEGIDLKHGEHCLLADKASDFTAACIRLLEDTSFGLQLAQSGRTMVSEHYTYPKMFESMLNEIKEL